MNTQRTRLRALVAAALGLLALAALSATSALAYNQVVRDDSSCCVVQVGGAWHEDNHPNGWDSNTLYQNDTSHEFQWYPFPSPSGISMCPDVHIADLPADSFNQATYTSFHPGRTYENTSTTLEQQYDLNDWITMATSTWYAKDATNNYQGDYLLLQNDGTPEGFGPVSADGAAFHYNGGC